MLDHTDRTAGGLVLLFFAVALQGVALSRPWLSDIGEPGDDPCRTAAWIAAAAMVVGVALVAAAYREVSAELREERHISANLTGLVRGALDTLYRERAERNAAEIARRA